MRGRIKHWRDDKGYGFITPDVGGVDVFVHTKEVRDWPGPLAPDAEVEFDETTTMDGKVQARNVRVISCPEVTVPANRSAGGGKDAVWRDAALAFLDGVMNDGTQEIDIRVEAATAILDHTTKRE